MKIKCTLSDKACFMKLINDKHIQVWKLKNVPRYRGIPSLYRLKFRLHDLGLYFMPKFPCCNYF